MTRGPVVITGGGTGGHVFPMQAIADALVARGVPATRLRYVGSRRGQEHELLGAGPVALTLLPGRGIRRSLAPGALVANAGALVGLTGAVASALVRVGRWRPSVVVSVGGYASFAVALAAVLWRRPLVLVELDATPGASHRLLDRFATRRCTALASTRPRTVVTGAPLRAAIANLDRSDAARRERRADQRPPFDEGRVVVVVMTGSLGARSVNRAVAELARRWCARDDVAIVHVTGRRDFDEVAAARPVPSALDYRVEAFADMSVLWGLCDVAVCRAGAATVAELAALAIPAVLVPLPGAPGDHQTRNACALVDAGAALLVTDDECTAEGLGQALERLLEPETRERMSSSAARLGRRDGAAAIAREVAEVGGLS